eukprot:TRINITY_DN708_c0_g1_i1.p1 TRINITY_DN708_c0_g1~~TRINITY_DN708_c0_g1_i1.p1  ORF type:complete len:2331 (-),score=536.50 TRINITY_DN708_c0_g1_i1:468-7460(-)
MSVSSGEASTQPSWRQHGTTNTRAVGSLRIHSAMSSVGSLRKMMASLQNTLFRSIFLMMKEETTLPALLLMFSMFLEHIQFLQYAFHSAIMPKFILETNQTYLAFNNIVLAVNIQSFLSVDEFWSFATFAIVVSVTTFLLFVYILVAIHKDAYMFLWPLKIVRTTVTLMGSILYLPFVRILTEIILPVSESSKAKVGSDPGIVIIAVCALLIIIFFAIISKLLYFDPNPKSKSAIAKPHGRVELLWVLFRTILVWLVPIVTHLDWSPHVIVIALIIGSIIMLMARSWYSSFYCERANQIAIALAAMISWAGICSAIASSMTPETYGNNSFDVILAVFGGGLLIIMPGTAWCVKHLHRHYFQAVLKTPTPHVVWKEKNLAIVVERTSKQKGKDLQESHAVVNTSLLSSAEVSGAQTPIHHLPRSTDTELQTVESSRRTSASQPQNGSLSTFNLLDTLQTNDPQKELATFGTLTIRCIDNEPPTINIDGYDLIIRSPLHVEIFTREVACDHSNPFAERNALSFFEACLLAFPKSAIVQISFARFLENATDELLRERAWEIYEDLADPAFDTPIDIQFQVFAAGARRDRYSSLRAMDAKDDTDVVAHLELQQNLAKAKDCHLRTLKHLHHYWSMLLLDEIDIHQLELTMHRIVKSQTSAGRAFSAVLNDHPKSPRILRAYARFLKEIRSDDVTAASILKSAEQYERNQETNFQSSKDMLTMECTMAVTGNGDIKAAKNVSLFSMTEDTMIGANISSFIPSSEEVDWVVRFAFLSHSEKYFVMALDRQNDAMLLDMGVSRLEIATASNTLRSYVRDNHLFNLSLTTSHLLNESLIFVDFQTTKSVGAGVMDQRILADDSSYDDLSITTSDVGTVSSEPEGTIKPIIVGVTKAFRTLTRLRNSDVLDKNLFDFITDPPFTTTSSLRSTMLRLAATNIVTEGLDVNEQHQLSFMLKGKTMDFVGYADVLPLEFQSIFAVHFTTSEKVKRSRRSSSRGKLGRKGRSSSSPRIDVVVEAESRARSISFDIETSDMTPTDNSITDKTTSDDERARLSAIPEDEDLKPPVSNATSVSDDKEPDENIVEVVTVNTGTPKPRRKTKGSQHRRPSDESAGKSSDTSGEITDTSATSNTSNTSREIQQRLRQMRASLNGDNGVLKSSDSVMQLRFVVWAVLSLLFVSCIATFIVQDVFFQESENQLLSQSQINHLTILSTNAGFATEVLDIQLKELRLETVLAANTSHNASVFKELVPSGFDPVTMRTDVHEMVTKPEFQNINADLQQLKTEFATIHNSHVINNEGMPLKTHKAVVASSHNMKVLNTANHVHTEKSFSFRDLGFHLVKAFTFSGALNVTLENERAINTIEVYAEPFFVIENTENVISAVKSVIGIVENSVKTASTEVQLVSVSTLLVSVLVILCLMWLTFRPVVSHIALENRYTLETFADIPRRTVIKMVNRYKRMMMSMEVTMEDNTRGEQPEDETIPDDISVAMSEASDRSRDKSRDKTKKNKYKRRTINSNENGNNRVHLRYVIAFGLYAILAVISFASITVSQAEQNRIHQQSIQMHIVQTDAAVIPFATTRMIMSLNDAQYKLYYKEFEDALKELKTSYLAFMNLHDSEANPDPARTQLLFHTDLCSKFTCRHDEERQLGVNGAHNLLISWVSILEGMLSTDNATRITFKTEGALYALELHQLVSKTLEAVEKAIIDELKTLASTETTSGMAIMFCTIAIIVFDLVLIFTPLLNSLNAQARHVQHMFLMIPVDTLVQLPHIMKMLGLDTMSDGASQFMDQKVAKKQKKTSSAKEKQTQELDRWVDTIIQQNSGASDSTGISPNPASESEEVSGEESPRNMLRDQPLNPVIVIDAQEPTPEIGTTNTDQPLTPVGPEIASVASLDSMSSGEDRKSLSTRLREGLEALYGEFSDSPKYVLAVLFAVQMAWWLPVFLVVELENVSRFWNEHGLLVASTSVSSFLGGATPTGMDSFIHAMLSFSGVHASDADIRTYTILAQAFGLSVACIFGFLVAVPLDSKVLFKSIIPAILGSFIGALIVSADRNESLAFENLMVVGAFVGIFLGSEFALTQVMGNIRMSDKVSGFDSHTRFEVMTVSLLGGMVTSLVGTGLDYISFTFMVLFLQIDINTAICTAVTLSGVNSVFSLFFELILQGIPSQFVIDLAIVSTPIITICATAGIWTAAKAGPTVLRVLTGINIALGLTTLILEGHTDSSAFAYILVLIACNLAILTYLFGVGGVIREANLRLERSNEQKEVLMLARAKRLRERKKRRKERKKKYRTGSHSTFSRSNSNHEGSSRGSRRSNPASSGESSGNEARPQAATKNTLVGE